MTEWLTILPGDCREVLATLPAESVNCVVTSPPYWGLRDYGTATWEGGAEDCNHIQSRALKRDTSGGLPPAGQGTRGTQSSTASSILRYRDTCGKCGARRIDSQLGLEPTPEEYVANLVDVFREVRRVLTKDGTVWLNLGDSYAGSGPSGATYQSETTRRRAAGDGTEGSFRVSKRLGERGLTYAEKKPISPPGYKPKDLVGIPWRVAFALQADGWWLRSDIIWAKPNPMPESVTDRPTRSHEYVFLLTKSARYYFDAEAVKEPLVSTPEEYLRAGKSVRENHEYGEVAGRPLGDKSFATVPNGRNIRTVWTIATQPYPGAHFATFPEALVEPCIKAGTSERGVCPVCGAAWVRVVERTVENRVQRRRLINHDRNDGGASVNADRWWTTTGWAATCDHDAEPVPAVVLDPFGGSGTTARVANRLSRRAVLIELNPDYIKQAEARNAQVPLGLGDR